MRNLSSAFPVEGRSGKKPSTPFPWKGDARRAGGWAKAKERKANLRRYAFPSFQRKEGKAVKAIYPFLLEREVAKTYLPPSKGRREKR